VFFGIVIIFEQMQNQSFSSAVVMETPEQSAFHRKEIFSKLDARASASGAKTRKRSDRDSSSVYLTVNPSDLLHSSVIAGASPDFDLRQKVHVVAAMVSLSELEFADFMF
jgi:hypothetical protein